MEHMDMDQEALKKLLEMLTNETGDELKNPHKHGIMVVEAPKHEVAVEDVKVDGPHEIKEGMAPADMKEEVEESPAEAAHEDESKEVVPDLIPESSLEKIKAKYFKR